MKKIKFLLFFFVILFAPNVFASEFNMNNYTSATLGGTKNRYRGTEIDNTGTANTYQFNTRYNGRISMLETYFDYPFVANTTYTLTYNMATEDFRNNFSAYYWWDCSETMNATNQHVGSFSYVSYKKVKFTFKPTENTTCIRVMLGSSNPSTTAITGVSNWNLSSITIYDPDWQSGSGSGQGSVVAPTPSPNSNQDIINNQNNNTQDIIDNNNQNTQDIISSIQETTQQVNDTITNTFYDKCPNLFDSSTIVQSDYTDNFPNIRLSSRQALYLEPGTYTFSTNLDLSTYSVAINILPNYPPSNSYNEIYATGYIDSSTKTFTLSNSGYFVTTFKKGNNLDITVNDIISYHYQLVKGSNSLAFCNFNSNLENKFDKFDQTLQDVKDAMTNDNVDNGVGTGFFNDFDDEDFGLSSIITIPLNTIQGLTSKSCVALNVPIPFTNSSVPLPCMTQIYEQNIPTIYNLWKIVSFGIIAYFIAIDIFHMVKGFKDPESDKVEVLDL